MQKKLIIIRLSSFVRHLSSVFCLLSSTLVEDSLQINPFYAKQTQCQVRSNQRKLFYNKYICESGHLVKSEKQTQFKACPEVAEALSAAEGEVEWANLVRRRRIANVFITKDYRKKDDFKVRINKPNFQNAKNEHKLIFYRGL